MMVEMVHNYVRNVSFKYFAYNWINSTSGYIFYENHTIICMVIQTAAMMLSLHGSKQNCTWSIDFRGDTTSLFVLTRVLKRSLAFIWD